VEQRHKSWSRSKMDQEQRCSVWSRNILLIVIFISLAGCLTPPPSQPSPPCLEEVCWLDSSTYGAIGIGEYPLLSGPDWTSFEWARDEIYLVISDRSSSLYGSIVLANLGTRSIDVAVSVPDYFLANPVVVGSELLFTAIPHAGGAASLWTASSMRPLFPSNYGNQYLIHAADNRILWEQDGDGDEAYLYDLEGKTTETLLLPPVNGTTNSTVVSFAARIVGDEVWVAVENRTEPSYSIWSYRQGPPSVVLSSDAPIEEFLPLGEQVVLQGAGPARVVNSHGAVVRQLGMPGTQVGAINCDSLLSVCKYTETVGDVHRLILELPDARLSWPESSHRASQMHENTLLFTDDTVGWRLFGLDLSSLAAYP
jgi:hypothetical protein